MTTELMLIGIKYQTIVNRWLGSFPIEFDFTVKEYKFNGNPRRLNLYYFTILFSFVMGYGPSNGAILVHFLIRPIVGFTMATIVMFIIVQFAGIVSLIGIPIYLFFGGRSSAMSVNPLFHLMSHLRSKDPPKQPVKYEVGLWGKFKKAKDLLWDEEDHWDLIGGVMVCAATFSALLPLRFSIITILIDMEPLKHFAVGVLGGKFVNILESRLLIGTVSLITLSVGMGSALRLTNIFVVLFMVTLQFYLKILRKIEKVFQATRTREQFETLHME
jgi:hypothetical protein